MMITKYYCDHCGNEVSSQSELLTVDMIRIFQDSATYNLSASFALCKDCVDEVAKYIGSAKHTKPPLGLVPRFIRDEERVREIIEAIDRYNEAGKPVPQEWLDELNEKTRKENRQ
jgi:hypothetical protein